MWNDLNILVHQILEAFSLARYERSEVGPTTQSISHNICLAMVIVDTKIIVFDEFQPSALPHVQLGLSEDVLETLVVSIDLTVVANKIVHPDLGACITVANSRS